MVLNCFGLFSVFYPSPVMDDLNNFSSQAKYLSTFNMFYHLFQARMSLK